MKRLGLVALCAFVVSAPAWGLNGDLLDTRTLWEKRGSPRDKPERTPEKALTPDADVPAAVDAMPGEKAAIGRNRWFFLDSTFVPDDDALTVLPTYRGFVARPPIPPGTLESSESFQTRPLVSVGFLFPVSRRWDAGWAVGFVDGPEGEAHARYDYATGFNTVDGQIQTWILRMTNTVRFAVPLTRRVHLRLRGGAGIAQVNMRDSVYTVRRNFSGFGSEYIGRATTRRSAVTFTYDVSPSIAIVGRRLCLDVGLSYVDFGHVGTKGFSPAFDWAPAGLRISLEF